MRDVKDEYPSNDAWYSFLGEIRRARGIFQMVRDMQCEGAALRLTNAVNSESVPLDGVGIKPLMADIMACAAQRVKDAWNGLALDKKVAVIEPIDVPSRKDIDDLNILCKAAKLNPHLCVCAIVIETEMLNAKPRDRIPSATVEYCLLSREHHRFWCLQKLVLGRRDLDAEFRMYDSNMDPILRGALIDTKAVLHDDGHYELGVYLFKVN